MKTISIFALFLSITFTLSAQKRASLDSITLTELTEDLAIMDSPFKAPPRNTVNINYKFPLFSNTIKKVKISRIDGKRVAKYKYQYADGVLVCKKLKLRNADKNIYADGTFYYSETDSSLLLAKYKLTKYDYSEYDISFHTKVFESERLTDHSSDGYILDSEALHAALIDALPETETPTFSQPNTFSLPIGSSIGCSAFNNWYCGPFTNCIPRYNDLGQLVQHAYLNNGVQTGYIQYYYNDQRISSAQLFQGGQLIEQIFLFYDQNGNLSSFQRVK